VRYFSSEDDDSLKADLHKKLALYFSKQPHSGHILVSLPYHLMQSKNTEELKSFLSDIQVFSELYNDIHKYDLISYWKSIPDWRTACPVIYR
jgi:hypothetical protein